MSHKRKPWQISRRAVLRGAGVSIALPLLDVMRPVASALGQPSTEGSPTDSPVRMAFLYMPNGVNPKQWEVQGTGRDFTLSPILEPLASLREECIVFDGLEHRLSDWGDGHYTKTAAWLTGTVITKTTGADVRSNGVSVDQVAAQKIGNLTALPSLELALEAPRTGVDVQVGFTQLYGHHISWSTPQNPVAREVNPRLAFDRLFRSSAGRTTGDSSDDRSVLDLVRDDAQSLRALVGAEDRRKLDEYLDSVRAVERRIAFESRRRQSEYMEDPLARREIESLDRRITDYYADPGRFYARGFDHTEHTRLMLDLVLLAFWTDSTRTASFMFGNDVSNKSFAFLEGVGGAFHELSHHENEAHKLEEYARINRWHVAQYAYLIERMRAIPEGEGSLLDHSMVLFGSPLRDGNAHSPHNLPIVLAGRGGHKIQPGRHVVYPRGTQLCNLYVSMLNNMGVPTEQFGDSTGPLNGLNDAAFAG